MSPVSFSESELQILIDLARPLSPTQRKEFMQILDQQLRNHVGELGAGSLSSLAAANAPFAGVGGMRRHCSRSRADIDGGD
jgi:hypothetical protein